MPEYLAPLHALAKRTGRSEDDPRLLSALEAATSRFVGEVHHSVFRIVDDEVELDGPGRSTLFLPGLPVESVASIYVDDVLVPASAYRASRATGIVHRRDGGCWPGPTSAIVVTYTHGFDGTPIDLDGPTKGDLPGIPRDIQAAVLEAAEAIVNVPAGIAGQSVLGDSVQFGSANVGATQQWVDTVANYAIQVSA